jgi:hypothetical protein
MTLIGMLLNGVAMILLYRGIRFALEKSDDENRLRLTEDGYHEAAIELYGHDKRPAHITVAAAAAVLLVVAVNVAGHVLGMGG